MGGWGRLVQHPQHGTRLRSSGRQVEKLAVVGSEKIPKCPVLPARAVPRVEVGLLMVPGPRQIPGPPTGDIHPSAWVEEGSLSTLIYSKKRRDVSNMNISMLNKECINITNILKLSNSRRYFDETF